MDNISRAFEWIAVGVLIVAFVAALAGVVYYVVRDASLLAIYQHWRAIFGRGLLVSLEILVAADLIRTVAVEPTLENIGVLALIVVVRTVLSFSLDIEIDGVLPWRKAELQARDNGATR
jgi:uncharacterized membrane protein